MFDYETLKIIWWLLVGVLLVGFAIMDGHDMGVGTLLPFVGRSDLERRVVINTVGPHWDGNQVWFITGGGAIFAAWPLVYATAFSGFYWAMLLVLWALFFRPVGFDYRSKIHNSTWRSVWDWGMFIGGFVPPVIFGVAFGNLLQGVPFQFDAYLVSTYTGSFWQLLNPFALLAGVNPRQVADWYLAVYVDAVDWVEEPNTLGMALFALGPRMTSKPYIASGAYIKRMSNACKQCVYKPDIRTGPQACPYTTLYWYFLMQHADLHRKNPRMALAYKNLDRMADVERTAISEWAEVRLQNLEAL